MVTACLEKEMIEGTSPGKRPRTGVVYNAGWRKRSQKFFLEGPKK